ncbi:unnamed protein product [Notodromas monacha]|uniref:Uncharacterized protein n=1 Tax=Notodromas monacha TaxID=399045 RepID=A0A7R9BU17_9CRUS|nr:unnamed protein product [Notodromas monacha]CAG0921417.1 unnamed protein product [Notodromas monacha]
MPEALDTEPIAAPAAAEDQGAVPVEEPADAQAAGAAEEEVAVGSGEAAAGGGAVSTGEDAADGQALMPEEPAADAGEEQQESNVHPELADIGSPGEEHDTVQQQQGPSDQQPIFRAEGLDSEVEGDDDDEDESGSSEGRKKGRFTCPPPTVATTTTTPASTTTTAATSTTSEEASTKKSKSPKRRRRDTSDANIGLKREKDALRYALEIKVAIPPKISRALQIHHKLKKFQQYMRLQDAASLKGRLGAAVDPDAVATPSPAKWPEALPIGSFQPVPHAV